MTSYSRARLSAETAETGDIHEIAGLSAACRLSLISDLGQMRAISSDWRALENVNQADTTVFGSYDWCMTWSEAYCQGPESEAGLQVIAGFEKDRLVFLLPLMVNRQLGLRTLSWLSEPFGQYGDVLCAKGHSARAWINASLSFLKRLKGVDLLYLRHIRADGILATHGGGQLIDARVPEEAPFLDLTAFKSEEEYDARYTGTQRKRRKKIRKALEHLGSLSFRRLPAGSLADQAMQAALMEKNAWLAERGRMNRVLSCPRHMTFLKALSRRNGPVSVVVTELSAADKPVSWEIAFRLGSRHFAYITSHVNALTDLSPGRLHMDLSQRQSRADGMATFDLMVPNDAHKESWSSGKVMTNDVFLPLSWGGAVMGHAYLRTLRPMLRTVYYWLEPRALRWLNFKSFGRRGAGRPEAP